MDFAATLEQAIAGQQRRALVVAVAVTAAGGAICVGMWFWGRMLLPLPLLLLLCLGAWAVALTGSSSLKALRSLRGGQPEHWLPSPSHGVLVATTEHLLGGGLRAELNRHADCRVTSISYQETEHALTVDVTTILQTRDGEKEDLRRSLVTLDPSVTSERAYAFAKHVLGLSQR